jgi:hypothetical protein
LFRQNNFLFLARGIHFPIALEGALKLKELSYIHAEGYPAGEMKHGPNALIDENLPVVFLAAYDPDSPESHQRYEKVLNNIKEVKSRDGIIVALGNEGDADLIESSDHFIPVPPTNEYLLSILEAIPLQLLAYHCAVRRGCDTSTSREIWQKRYSGMRKNTKHKAHNVLCLLCFCGQWRLIVWIWRNPQPPTIRSRRSHRWACARPGGSGQRQDARHYLPYRALDREP